MSLIQNIQLSLEYPVRIPEQRLAYWPVPKNACTSLKYAFYFLRTGRQFKPSIRYKQRYLYQIHRVFPSRHFQTYQDLQAWTKLAVIRDPFRRLISAYCNRVIHHRDLYRARAAVEQSGLSCEPSIQEFVQHLEQYRLLSTIIRDHTDPQWLYLGDEPDYYDYIVDIKQLSHLPAIIQTPALILRKTQAEGGSHKHAVCSDINSKTRDLIFDFYQRDYDLYGQFLTDSISQLAIA